MYEPYYSFSLYFLYIKVKYFCAMAQTLTFKSQFKRHCLLDHYLKRPATLIMGNVDPWNIDESRVFVLFTTLIIDHLIRWDFHLSR